MRFPTPCDPISKHCRVYPIQRLFDQLRHAGFVNVKLGRLLIKHVVKRVSVDLLVSWNPQSVQLNLRGVAQNQHFGLWLYVGGDLLLFAGKEAGSDADGHRDLAHLASHSSLGSSVH